MAPVASFPGEIAGENYERAGMKDQPVPVATLASSIKSEVASWSLLGVWQDNTPLGESGSANATIISDMVECLSTTRCGCLRRW